MSAREHALEQSPRRHVRYAYLIDAWTELEPERDTEIRNMDHLDVFLDAPEQAVITAMARDRDHYLELLRTERNQRQNAERDLDALRSALRLAASHAGLTGAPA